MQATVKVVRLADLEHRGFRDPVRLELLNRNRGIAALEPPVLVSRKTRLRLSKRTT
jgi:hypothetical protein